jgi:NAD(P)-dependent dehydrogenase (short-subunit alcohol dehydrogenase family)
MPNRNIVITGASDGIGAAAARRVAGGGDHLFLVGRSKEKTETIARETDADYFLADFTGFDDVRRLADELRDALNGEGINVLANNVGGIFGDSQPTVDGHEKTMQVNHLSPFLLTNLLLPQLRSGRAAVVNTSSIANRIFGRLDVDDLDNRRRFSANKAYGDAKLANILFTTSLHTNFRNQGISSVAFHPGNVRTNFASDTSSVMKLVYRSPLKNLLLISPEHGGENLAWFINGIPDTTWQSGAYYDQRKRSTRVNPEAKDPALAEALWQRSAQIVGL